MIGNILSKHYGLYDPENYIKSLVEMYSKLHNFLDIKQPKDLSIFISIFKNIEYYREITPQEKEIAINIEKVLIG